MPFGNQQLDTRQEQNLRLGGYHYASKGVERHASSPISKQGGRKLLSESHGIWKTKYSKIFQKKDTPRLKAFLHRSVSCTRCVQYPKMKSNYHGHLQCRQNSWGNGFLLGVISSHYQGLPRDSSRPACLIGKKSQIRANIFSTGESGGTAHHRFDEDMRHYDLGGESVLKDKDRGKHIKDSVDLDLMHGDFHPSISRPKLGSQSNEWGILSWSEIKRRKVSWTSWKFVYFKEEVLD